MNSISKKSESRIASVRVYRGGLGITIKGQKGHFYGVMPPTRKRGDITTFSYGSARRLRECLAMASPKQEGLIPFGVCLTIPGAVLAPSVVREIWHDFVVQVKRTLPALPFVWRIELQRRKQAHWHLIAWAEPLKQPDGSPLPFSTQIETLTNIWQKAVLKRCCALSERTFCGFILHGVQVRPLLGSSATGIVGYLCEHESKHKQEQLGWQGRQWGVVGASNLDFEGECVATVSLEEHKQAARQYRRLQENLRKRGGFYTGVSVTPSGNVSKSIFGRDEVRFLRSLELFHVEQNVKHGV